MEHHWIFSRNPNRGELQPGERPGVMYFSWTLGEPGPEIDRGAFYEKWHSFAQRLVAEHEGLAALKVRVRRMHRDLLLIVTLPAASLEHAEKTLFELAMACRKELAERFAELEPGAAASAGSRLRAGAAVARSSSGTREDLEYEAFKEAVVRGQTAGSLERSLRRKALDRLLLDQSIVPVYQPILSIRQDSVFGYEALTRSPGSEWFRGPLELFAFAEEEGKAFALDSLAREKAIVAGGGKLGSCQKLFINILTQALDDPEFLPGRTRTILAASGLAPCNVVFEVTERSSIRDFSMAKRALDHYRNQGYQIAIDDVGSGYSSLQSIVELRPDYIKVDRSIIQNIHADEVKEHTLYTLQQLAFKLGIALIAEGIEKEEELAKIREMGVPYAQGYHLGRPAPL